MPVPKVLARSRPSPFCKEARTLTVRVLMVGLGADPGDSSVGLLAAVRPEADLLSESDLLRILQPQVEVEPHLPHVGHGKEHFGRVDDLAGHHVARDDHAVERGADGEQISRRPRVERSGQRLGQAEQSQAVGQLLLRHVFQALGLELAGPGWSGLAGRPSAECWLRSGWPRPPAAGARRSLPNRPPPCRSSKFLAFRRTSTRACSSSDLARPTSAASTRAITSPCFTRSPTCLLA